MNCGPATIEISIARMPARRTSATSASPPPERSATTLEADRARALTSTQSPGSDERRQRRRPASTRRRPARDRHAAGGLDVAARERADGDEHVDAQPATRGRPRGGTRRVRRRARPCRRGRRRVRRPPARVGEVLERRAHRDRVRVVGVVDQERRRPGAAAPRRASARTRRRRAPAPSSRPSASYGGERGERVRGVVRAAVKSTLDARRATVAQPRSRSNGSSVDVRADADDLEVVARSTREAPAGTIGRRRPGGSAAISSPFARATPLERADAARGGPGRRS